MSEPCTRWSDEGLLAQERGAPIDPHFETCPDCLRARAADAALSARLVTAGSTWQPPGDWEARVFARIAREQPARRFSWWYALFPALAAAGLAVFLWRPRAPVDDAVTLVVGVVDAAQVVRGENPKPGDTLTLTATAGGMAHLSLRVYRDDRTLVFACGGPEPACPRVDARVAAQVVMTAPGTYRSIVLTGAAPVPGPAGTLDADVAAARAAGAKVVQGEVVRVW
jgi:hypothetical protein